LKTKYNREFDASALFEKLDNPVTEAAHRMFTSLATMILMALAIFLNRILIRKICHMSQEPPMLLPLAPPMLIHTLITTNWGKKSNTSTPISISIS
jgi:hypothetical protein